MALPARLQIALKEWQTVCNALHAGCQILLLRKGGIYESASEFEIEHRQFLLFPTFLHQNLDMLKPGNAVEKHLAEPDQITLTTAAQITDIIPVRSRQMIDALDAHHIWSPALIDMRFNYRPENPLYLLLVRAYILEEPVTIQNTPAYAGCKSWVPLKQPVTTANATPAIDDAAFNQRRRDIHSIIHPFAH
jgi:hypothetical protein